MKINLNKISYYLIFINIILYLILDFITVATFPFLLINILMSLLILIVYRKNYSIFMILIYFLLFLWWNLYNSYYKYNLFVDILKILNFILICCVCSNKVYINGIIDFIISKKKFINSINYIVIIVEMFSLISGSGYYIDWDGSYFKGTSYNTHVFSYLMLTMICLNLVKYKLERQKKYIILSGLYFFFILISGARTALLPVIIVFMFIISKYLIAILPIGAIILSNNMFLEVISKIPIIKKILYQMTTGSFSNGRNIFWVLDYNYYLNIDLFKKIFGSGIDYLYHFNYINIGNMIWAHNDYLSILVGMGIVGLILYIFCFFNMSKVIFINSGISKWVQFVLCIVVLSFFNGVYPYQYFVLSMPLIVTFFSIKN